MGKKESFQALIDSERPVFIDFHATWCGPCKAMEPILKDMAAELDGHVRVIKIDVDKNAALSNKLRIRGVPTFALYHRGKQLWRQSGMLSLAQLKQVIAQHTAGIASEH